MLKNFIYCKKNPASKSLFQSPNSDAGCLFGDFKLLKTFDETALKNGIFIDKSLKKILQSSVAGSNFHLKHTLMT